MPLKGKISVWFSVKKVPPSTLTFIVASVEGTFVSASRHEGEQGEGALTFVMNKGASVADAIRAIASMASFGFKEEATSPMGKLWVTEV